jgi:outer membrane protein assembly factor BamB
LHTGGVTESSPVLDESGNIFFQVNGCLYSVANDGEKTCWYCSGNVDQTPAVAADGLIYFSAPWRRLVAIKPDCVEQWHFDTELNLSTSPVIGSNGIVYACDGRLLYAVIPPNNPAPPAKSSWPMFRANPRHTGCVQSEN